MQSDRKGNEFEITKDGEQVLRLNEELSEKIMSNEKYMAFLTDIKYNNPDLKIELSGGNHYETLEQELISEKVNELLKVDELSNILKQYNTDIKGFRRYNVLFPQQRKTPYANNSGPGYTSMGGNNRGYNGSGGVCNEVFDGCGSP